VQGTGSPTSILQWAPLNVITDNVIIWLILSDLKRPGQLSITSNTNICLL
jgi:hypothetical protein